MWPLLLDMTKEESLQSLRCLELEAYASLVTALRAQGPLNSEKVKILKETCTLLNITQDRHKAEVRRVVNDEKLNTIAYHVSGQRTTSDEWAMEGRRLCPLMPRVAPQTAFSAIADEVADSTSKMNRQLPSPSSTERKRSPVSVAQCAMPSDHNKTVFRVPELPKVEENKKRKLPIGVENSSLAQHLISSPKMSRIQQIYRQKTKARQKEQHLQMKIKQEQDLSGQKSLSTTQLVQKFQPKYTVPPTSSCVTNSKMNILQNISVPMSDNDSLDQIKTEAGYGPQKILDKNILLQSTSSDGIVKTKPLLNNSKISQHITLKHTSPTIPGTSGEVAKTLKVCPTRKTISTKSVPAGQKLIVVSNPQSVTNPSILHRTLTIPFVKNLSMKNLDKFKIVNPTSSTIQLTPISSTITTNSAKHKVVTVRTNQAVKKVIPLSQLQVINAKGNIKVLPIGGKIVTKSNVNSTSAPIFIVNTANNLSGITKSTSSTPVVMSCKTEEPEKTPIKIEGEEEAAENKLILKSPTMIEEFENNLSPLADNSTHQVPVPNSNKEDDKIEVPIIHEEDINNTQQQPNATLTQDDDTDNIKTEVTENSEGIAVQEMDTSEVNVAELKLELKQEDNQETEEQLLQEENFTITNEEIEDNEKIGDDNFINEEAHHQIESEEINLIAEEEFSTNTDEDAATVTFTEDPSIIEKKEEEELCNEYNIENANSLEDIQSCQEQEENLNIQQDVSTLHYVIDQEHSNEETLEDNYEVEQPSNLLNIVGEVNVNNEKYLLENLEPEIDCVQLEQETVSELETKRMEMESKDK